MIVQIKALDGTIVEYEDSKIIGKGEMKDVYFSPDKSYVVAFYRNSSKDQEQLLDRLETIVGPYRESIFNNEGGRYWEPLYCWPTKVLIHNNRVGLVSPTYRSCFFFRYGSEDNDSGGIRGKEKEGKWFSSIRNQRFLDPRERGNWKGYVIACQKIAQAVKRLNAAGLAHSDLSYKNVLIDPPTGQISIIDLDGLVVTGKFNPEVMGTSDFIAPEVIATQHLSLTDPARVLPSIDTDCHALATLIYMYLLNRHPLKGGKVYDLDPDEDEEMIMGERALFIEHPTNFENRVKVSDLYPAERECGDPAKTPYTLCGPYLKTLFERAFIDGLHNPKLRPRADEWATALVNTYELLVPCTSMVCEHGWFVYDKGVEECPFCHTRIQTPLPVFYFYRRSGEEEYALTNTRFVGFNGKKLCSWLLAAERRPLEFTSEKEFATEAYISFENGNWYVNNVSLSFMQDALYRTETKTGESYKITDSCCLFFSSDLDELVSVRLGYENRPRSTIRTRDGGESSYLFIRSENSINRLKASVNKLKNEHPRFYNKYKFLFDKDEIILPDGIINREYNLDLKAIFPTDCTLQFIGLDSCGLYYSKSSSCIRGFPSQVGDISILINVRLPMDMIKVSKNAKLTIRVPDAKDSRMDENESSDGVPQLPGANLEQTYRVNFNDVFQDIEIENVIGHDTLGLTYNNHTKILSGVPNQKGRFMLKIRYRSKGLGGSKLLLLSKNVILRVDDAVKITWNDIPTPTDISFYKPDVFRSVSQVHVNESKTSMKVMLMAGIRGRLHANNGLPRNADCASENIYGWVIAAMADGSDKAVYSREGSRVAVNAAVRSLASAFDRAGSSVDSVVHGIAAQEHNGSRGTMGGKSARAVFEKMVADAFRNAVNEVAIQSNFANIATDLMDTNLSLMILKRFDFGWFVLTASVGHFIAAVCNGNYDILPLGFNQYGDYIFRDGTIMEPRYVDEKELRLRIDYKIVDTLVMVMYMNRSLSREIFASMPQVRSEEKWTEWLADLATNVDLKCRDTEKTSLMMEEYIRSKLMSRDNGDKSLILIK